MPKLVMGRWGRAQGLSTLRGSWLGSKYTKTSVKLLGHFVETPYWTLWVNCPDFCKISLKCHITSQILGRIIWNCQYWMASMYRNGNYIWFTLVQCYQLKDSMPKRQSGGPWSPVSGLACPLISYVVLAKLLEFSEPLAQSSSLSNVSPSYSPTFLSMATNRAPSHPSLTCSWQSQSFQGRAAMPGN